MSHYIRAAFVLLVTVSVAVTSVQCQIINATNLLEVEISNGRLRGRDVGYYYIWDAIPYAEPPVGELRFEAPQPYKQKWTTVFNATTLPQFCMQWYRDGAANKLRGVEDCLVLSIYRPKILGNGSLPVMVFLHGGGFMFGGILPYDPDHLMASRSIILVKVQYRVGPLGFFSTQDAVFPGNNGLKDQRLALQWIKTNINRFGGDPTKIMLYGVSAGAASAHYHMLQPSLNDTVKVVVSASGVALSPWAFHTRPQQNAFKLANLVNCSTTQGTQTLKKCLKQVTAEDLVRNVQGLMNFGYNPVVTFGPVIEPENATDAFLTRHPLEIIKSGNFSHLPWLVSYTAEDGGFNAAELMRYDARTKLELIYFLNDRWQELLPQNFYLHHISPKDPQKYAIMLKEKYLGNLNFTKENYLKVQEMYTDILFRNGALKALQLHSEQSKAPVYGYVYSNPADFNMGYDFSLRRDIKFGTNHLDDVSLIMDMRQRSTPRPDEVAISHNLVNMLIDFVETGTLSYADCKFEDNTKRKSEFLNLLLIERESCKNMEQKTLSIT